MTSRIVETLMQQGLLGMAVVMLGLVIIVLYNDNKQNQDKYNASILNISTNLQKLLDEVKELRTDIKNLK